MCIGYTISETMDAGWCWQIEHPERIHQAAATVEQCLAIISGGTRI
jgi:hypothetical protein